MEFLPIKYLRNEDKERVDDWIIKLATLQRSGVPVLDGIVFSPPNFKEAFKKFFIIDDISLKNRVREVKKYFENPPDFFVEEILKKERQINSRKLWLDLIEEWLGNFKKINNERTFSLNNLNLLKGIPIFFAEKVVASGVVNVVKDFTFQDNSFDSKIKVEKGKLDSKHLKELDILAIKAEKILGLGFEYRWVLEEVGHGKGIFFISISHTGNFSIPLKEPIFSVEVTNFRKEAEKNNLPIKVFLNQLSLPLPYILDGAIVDTSEFKDDEGLREIIKCCKDHQKIPLLFKFTDEDLIKRMSLERKCKNLLFLRKREKFLNVVALIPSGISVDEFLKLKRDLSVLGISRKASLKLWVEFRSPSNIFDIENYALSGIDGVVLNLDELFKNFFVLKDLQAVNRERIETFIKFLDEGMRLLSKLKISLIASGELVDKDEILRFLILKGVYAVAVSPKRHQIFLMDLPWMHLQVHRNFLS